MWPWLQAQTKHFCLQLFRCLISETAALQGKILNQQFFFSALHLRDLQFEVSLVLLRWQGKGRSDLSLPLDAVRRTPLYRGT